MKIKRWYACGEWVGRDYKAITSWHTDKTRAQVALSRSRGGCLTRRVTILYVDSPTKPKNALKPQMRTL